MSLILIGTSALGVVLLLLAIFLRENRVVAMIVALVGLLMLLGGVGAFVLVVSLMG